MRLPSVIAVLLALAPAIAVANPPPHRSDRSESGRAADPAIARDADGSTIIRRTLPAYPTELDDAVRMSDGTKVARSPLGRRRSPSEQEIDEDLERAFEQAAETARFGAPD